MSLSGNPFDLSVTEDYPIYITIGSLNSKRMITLKPYIESFNFSVDKNKEEFKANDYIAYKDMLEKGSVITCSLSLIIPAANLEDATINVAKIVDLQRMINAQANEISTLLVHFCNLINSGAPSGNRVLTAPPSDFDDLLKIGVACVCDEIAYDPDLEKGMFRASSGKLVPKAIKLELKLNYLFQDVSNSEQQIIGKFRYLNSYTSNGLMAINDRPLFPFGLFYSAFEDVVDETLITQEEGPIEDFKNLKGKGGSWIFIGNNINFAPDPDQILNIDTTILNETGSTLANKAEILNSIYNEESGIKSQRYVYFDAFIKSFNRKVKSEAQVKDNDAADEAYRTFFTSTKTDGVTFDIEFDSPAYNVKDAMINLGKIQTLIRLFAATSKLSPQGVRANGTEYVYKFIQVSANESYCHVCIPSFLQSANSGPLTWDESQEPSYSYENSIKAHMISLSINIDAAAGFFYIKDDNYLIPKNFSIKIGMMPNATQLLSNYKFTEDQNKNRTYSVADEGFGINDVAGGGKSEETENSTTVVLPEADPNAEETTQETAQVDETPDTPAAPPATTSNGTLGPAEDMDNSGFY